jgi:predicted transposase YbfD/YdcC
MSEVEDAGHGSLTEHLENLPDPRSAVNREHSLVDVVVISICAVIAGADGPTGIAEWARSPGVAEWLRRHLALPNGIPAKDTYRRVLQRLQPEAFQRCFAGWLQSLVGSSEVRFLAIDGKTLRRSHDRSKSLGALHLVSVWATERKLTLAQVATAEKSNEITAIPQLLDLVDVTDAIVTIDAMGCQRAIATKIVERGGDYVLPTKGNQGRLEQAVTEFFADHLEDDFSRVTVSRLKTTETHHGRREKRVYFQVNVPADFPGAKRWKGLHTLGLVVRTREIDGRETDEIQGSISSLKRNVKLFAKAVRGHWGIENACHWTLDMTFREDESRTRDRCVGENLAWLRRFALGLLRQHPDAKTSLAMKRRKAGWSVSFLSEVLFSTTT